MSELTPAPTIVQLDAAAPAGLLIERLDGARVIRFDEGELLPPLTSISHLVVLGGFPDAYDKALTPIAQLIKQAVDGDLPVLGICLGAQLLAAATGGVVTVAAPSGPERGIIDIRLRPDASDDPMLGPVADALGRDLSVVSMHSDAITDLPPGANWLASSPRYPFQAFRIGSAVGVQFHPEADAATYADWQARKSGVDVTRSREEWQSHAEQFGRLAELIADGLLASSAHSSAR